jgi:poly-beta-1,6-N-acetyl-D-glucosamine N-deacetylase
MKIRFDTFEKIICTFLDFTPMPFLTREILQRRKVTIIVYHDPDPSTLDFHIAGLKKKYNIISLKDYLDSRKSGNTAGLPPKSLIITLDDGYRSNYKLLPVFRKHKIIPTIFLCSGFIDTNRHFWGTEVRGESGVGSIRVVPDIDKVNALSKTGFAENREFAIREALLKNEILEMKGIIDFQSHTVFHACLPKCTPERARDEIASSKRDLEERYGLTVNALSYPHGDYSPAVEGLARQAGYECGITAELGFNDEKTDIFRLKRIVMRDGASTSEAFVRACGLWGVLRIIAKPILLIRAR